MSAPNAALEYARKHREQHLEELREVLRIPSISTLRENAPDLLRNAQWLQTEFKKRGLERVEIIPTEGHPVVYGEWLGAPGRPTVLIYGHYDVQPVDPLNEWVSGPFEADIRDDYVFARGASDMKGQIYAAVKAVECLQSQGALPVNVKIIIEGEEEIGSPNLAAFIDKHKEKLACDVVLNCDSFIQDKDTPSIVYSLRGLSYFEISVQTHAKDLHSGMIGGSVRNPIHVLCEVLAGMHDAEGRVTVPGFYDAVRPLDEEERAVLAKVPYSDERWLEISGSHGLFGEPGYTTTERIGARPTLEINGIWGGFTAEGAKTVLPARAHAKVSCRLVADQKGEDIEKCLAEYLKSAMPDECMWSLHTHSHGQGALMDRKSAYMRAAIDALVETFDKEPLFTRMGGTVPVVGMMQDKLGVDSVMLGFGLPDDGIHGPNERMYIPNYYRGIETYIHFLSKL